MIGSDLGGIGEIGLIELRTIERRDERSVEPDIRAIDRSDDSVKVGRRTARQVRRNECGAPGIDRSHLLDETVAGKGESAARDKRAQAPAKDCDRLV